MISMQRILLNKNVLWGCLGMLIYYAIMELYFLYFIGIEYSLFDK